MASTPQALVEMSEAAWDDGDLDEALALAEQALAAQPGLVSALDVRAHALAELGDWEAADEAFDELRAAAPDEPAYDLSAADVLIRQPGDDRDRLEAGLTLLDEVEDDLEGDAELVLAAEVLRGVAFNALGDFELAHEALARALKLDPDHPEARLEQAMAWFEQSRFDQARAALERLTRDEPDDAFAWHGLGLVQEQLGRDPTAAFQKARTLSPDDFPAPVVLAPAEFDAAVQQAIAALPEHSKAHLANTVIDVEPLPGKEDLQEGVSPSILGIFRGVPIGERSPLEPSHHQTARITLFQKNLERFATTRDELLEQISVTVLHEVGHLLGLDEDELYDRGLD